jgi:hypothetical protein
MDEDRRAWQLLGNRVPKIVGGEVRLPPERCRRRTGVQVDLVPAADVPRAQIVIADDITADK